MTNRWRVRTTFTGPTGSPWLSTMVFDTTALPGAQTIVGIVGDFWDAVDTHMNSTVAWSTDPVVDVFDDATGQLVGFESTTPESGAGASATAPLPWATQICINWRTSTFVGGREIRGKTYIPGITTSGMTSGSTNSTVRAAIQTAADGLVSAGPIFVYSRKNAQAVEAVAANVKTQFAVLRSRRD